LDKTLEPIDSSKHDFFISSIENTTFYNPLACNVVRRVEGENGYLFLVAKVTPPYKDYDGEEYSAWVKRWGAPKPSYKEVGVLLVYARNRSRRDFLADDFPVEIVVLKPLDQSYEKSDFLAKESCRAISTGYAYRTFEEADKATNIAGGDEDPVVDMQE
jgi:hypothetical protein